MPTHNILQALLSFARYPERARRDAGRDAGHKRLRRCEWSGPSARAQYLSLSLSPGPEARTPSAGRLAPRDACTMIIILYNIALYYIIV